MTIDTSLQQTSSQAVEQALRQAVIQHQAGQLELAGKLYRGILQIKPNHPEANHNLGVLSVQLKQPAAGLPHFMVALEADPTRGQYWLSYIDALYQSGQLDDARQVLALAQQQGLQGEEIEALASLLEGGASAAAKANIPLPSAANKSLPVSSVNLQSNPSPKKIKPDKPSTSTGTSFTHKGKEPSSQEINALVALFNHGCFAEAATVAQTMTERFPQYWVGWKMLGVVYNQMGRSADALVSMQRTVALVPKDAEAHNNLGITLQDMGRLDEAEASYRRAIKLNPDYAQALGNLGSVLQDKGCMAEAETSYRRALRVNPDYAKAHNNLGSVLQDAGRLDEAESSYLRALEIKPDYVEAHNNLGITLKDAGNLEAAERGFLRALQIKPDYAEAHYNLGCTLKDLGRLDEAEACCRRALQIDPDYADAHSTLGVILYKLGRLDLAEACYRRALQIKPDFAEVQNNLGAIYNDQNRLDEAEACYRRALEIKPEYAMANCNLGGVLHDLGRLEEAEACWRLALGFKPDLVEAYSNLLFCLSQIVTVDAKTLYSEHLRFGEQFEASFAGYLEHTNSRNPERCLQIGFVSGDLRNHAVANFIDPVLAHLSGYPQLSLHAYSNHVIEDDVTLRLRGYFAHWHQIDSISDAALAQKIRADGIDILIDLSGHTAKNRLLTFARKPAPVQVSWMGYPGTTGLSAMDYYFADRHFLPPGKFDDQFTEKIVRLPASVPFLPAKEMPPVNRLPALSNGYLTFGSFNRVSKLSPSVIALWSQLLRELPDSRMVLGGMPERGNSDMLINWFKQEGIGREKLDLYSRSQLEIYLKLHQQVDICLDTFPYNGGTTTFHALVMGVPTLSLAGPTAAGRSGAAILGSVGLDSFVAHDAADFVQKGLSWGHNLTALSDIRTTLRERFAMSARGKPEIVAAGLEHALRIMWQRWCAGLPTESFEVTQAETIEVMPEAEK